MSLNKCLFIGNLGKDPEVRFTTGGKAVCRFSIAVNEAWKDANGDKQERTEWIPVEVWGKRGEACGQYLAKGRQVFVEGSFKTQVWEKDGQKHYKTFITAQKVDFLGGPRGGGSAETDNGGFEPAGAPPLDDDIPFIVWGDFKYDRWFI